MSDPRSIHFRKMNGLGNDFVVVDVRAHDPHFSAETVRAIADRKTGIGCDQFILIERPRNGGDCFMGIRNADGGEVEACGNAARCIASLMLDETGKTEVIVETLGAMTRGSRAPDGNVTVDMGTPRLEWHEIPLAEEIRDTRGIELQIGPIDNPILHTPAVVNVGNPHAIFFIEDVNSVDLSRVGPLLENHPMFPERANISLAQVISRDHILLKVWERGAGLTRACGTAACAAAVAGARKRLTNRAVTVTLPGGDLHLHWREEDDHILMTGPATFDDDGTLDPAFFGPRS
ncbi:MAG: diaminopimelate epimerase [Alphaproteobacteria bacterium]|mgnify:CR=1 FL=1|nr:diaminopimelate epimerase [Rhodobiaceae bacterium]MBO6542952.1 diaminopimelate epimerase [Alphaproteobacteria bacterium]MBO6627121.1 diaminopimelate epimerase [Alphaproteobacteria bacterium]MDF1626388.1 diaminopimelate epimerase [Parvibaculaceae bacterium]